VKAIKPTPEPKENKMSRKDFVAVAEAIKTALNSNQSSPEAQKGIRMAAFSLAATFSDLNPRFDRNGFLTACGVN
jgi:hypothetical protein